MYYVGVVVSVSVGGSCCISPAPHTTQPRSPPCLPALPPSRLTLHTVSRSLGLSDSQDLTILAKPERQLDFFNQEIFNEKLLNYTFSRYY